MPNSIGCQWEGPAFALSLRARLRAIVMSQVEKAAPLSGSKRSIFR